MLQVRAGESTKRCGLINPKGYGSQDDTDRFPVATWLTGSEIFGLPEVVRARATLLPSRPCSSPP
jgi:hypothetical protein